MIAPNKVNIMKHKLQSERLFGETLKEVGEKVTDYCNKNSIKLESVAITGHYSGKSVGEYDYFMASIFYRFEI